MLLDCFTFFNELDILEGRLEYLYDVVDYFIISETNITHSGKPKPLTYLNNIERFSKYSNKILYSPFAANTENLDFSIIPTSVDYNSSHWKMENIQRNHIGKMTKMFSPDTFVMVSDVDEIPNKALILVAINEINKKTAGSIVFEQEFFYYNFNQKKSAPWRGTVIATNQDIQTHSPQWFRDIRWNMPVIQNAGWHLSYWGSPEKVATKIKSFAHQEFNTPETTDFIKIQQKILSGTDPFNDTKLTKTDIDNIPKDVYKIFNKGNLI